jgi:hypothetical protein
MDGAKTTVPEVLVLHYSTCTVLILR